MTDATANERQTAISRNNISLLLFSWGVHSLCTIVCDDDIDELRLILCASPWSSFGRSCSAPVASASHVRAHEYMLLIGVNTMQPYSHSTPKLVSIFILLSILLLVSILLWVETRCKASVVLRQNWYPFFNKKKTSYIKLLLLQGIIIVIVIVYLFHYLFYNYL